MKKLIGISLFALGGSLLAACGGTPLLVEDLKVDESPRVVLGVTGSPPALDIVRTGSTRCPGKSAKPGCIESPTNQAVTVTFVLRDSPDWRFSRFEICAGGEKPTPGSCKLELFERMEFGAFARKKGPIEVPSSKGRINLRKVSNDPDKELGRFFVVNLNSFKADYYYRVQVCSTVEEATCLWNEDPRWVNKGRY